MRVFLILLRFILKLFSKRLVVVPPPLPPPPVIPHPEESTVFDLDTALSKWLDEWEVFNRLYFKAVVVRVVENLIVNPYGKVPAATYYWLNPPRIDIDPLWINPGVLAHEMAHISYYNLLSKTHKAEFVLEYQKVLGENKLLQHIVHLKSYMQTGDIIECHADVYRYMGHEMPENLKQYYPNLIH